MQSQLDCFILEKEMIHNATFVHSDHGHAKMNKPRENEAKTRRSIYGTWIKKVGNHILNINFIELIDRDSELIKNFKTMTSLLHTSQGDLSE